MPGEVVPNHQHPQRRQLFGQRHFHRKPLLPAVPLVPVLLGTEHLLRWRQGFKDCTKLFLEPGVEHLVGGSSLTPRTRTSPLAGWKRVSNLAVPWRTYSWGLRFGSPIGCQLTPGYGTVWYGPASSSVHTVSPELSPSVSSALDQLFLAVASGSMTSTTSPLRFRSTTPVSHQLRSLCHSKPASFEVFQMV